MSRSSIRYIDTTYVYGQHAVAAPVTNPVIYGRFPKYVHRKSPAEKINKFLSAILLILVVLSLVSYYFVSDDEKKMNSLGREIVALTNENIELQNKLDSLKSFNNVDKTMQQNNMLQKAGQVIETQAIEVEPGENPLKKSKKKLFNYAIGF